MKYANLSKYLDANNVCMFGYDMVNNEGEVVRHGELPFYVTLNGKVVMNPLVKIICDDYKASLENTKVVENTISSTKPVEEKKEEKKEIKDVQPVTTTTPINPKPENKKEVKKETKEVKKESTKKEEKVEVNKDGLLVLAGRIILLAGIGGLCFFLGTHLKGCGNEKKAEPSTTPTTSTEDNTSTNNVVVVEDEEITPAEAIADVKNIELELIEKGILVEGTPAYDEILDGARALYARVNAEELSTAAINALGFKDLSAIQIIGKSFDSTGEIMTNAYQKSAKGENDYLRLSIFCHDEQDKKIVDQMHDIAVESLTTDSKSVAEKNANIVGNYYRNLKPAEFNYSVGVGESLDSVLNLYAEEIIQKAAQFGVKKKTLKEIRELPGYGNYSYEYRILENKCTPEVQKQIQLN